MKSFNLLIIDDTKEIHEVTHKALKCKNKNIHIFSAYNGKEASSILQKHLIQLVFIDYQLKNESGLILLKTLIQSYPQIPFIMISGENNTKVIVDAIKLGAKDFIIKPFDYPTLSYQIDKLYDQACKKNIYVKTPALENIIGESSNMLSLFKEIRKVAISNVPILILGETGTGKELIAQAIHASSKRKNHPFIAVNCGAIPKELIESELFGHERGAFTGAIGKKIGYFEQANKGTLFLDEIGDLNLDLQVKFLRTLQEQEITRIGGTKKIKVDLRIISATHRNLKEYIQKNLFREDLFFRLNVIPLNVKPLRERKEDIPLLAKYFLDTLNQQYGSHKSLSEKAIKDLTTYSWKGNVRELQNIIKRIFFTSDETIISKIPQHILDLVIPYQMFKFYSAIYYLKDFASLKNSKINHNFNYFWPKFIYY